MLPLAALLVSGCGTFGGSGRGGGDVVTLSFWNGFTGPDGATMERIVRSFNRRHPHIRVRMQIIPWGTYYDKLTLGLAYGNPPDAFILHVNRFPEYAHYESLEPIGSLLEAGGLDPDDFMPIPWKAGIWEGTQYGIPLDCHPQGLYYNIDLFRKAGIVDSRGNARPPTNLAEFLDAAKKLTIDRDGDGKPEQWGFAFTWMRTNAFTFMGQFGGGMLDSDLKRSALERPEAQKALGLMKDLIYRYKVAPSPEGQDSWVGFQTGRVAMALEGVYMLSSLEEQEDLRFAGAPCPQFGPVKAAWAGTHMLVMPRGISREKREAAWTFIRYLSDNSLEWAKGGQVPVRKSILHTPEFRRLSVQHQFSRELPYVQYEPATVSCNQVEPFMDAAIEAILGNIKPASEALREASMRIDTVLARQ